MLNSSAAAIAAAQAFGVTPQKLLP